MEFSLATGDSFNSSLVAVVSVDEDNLKAWAASEGIKVDFFFSILLFSLVFLGDMHTLKVIESNSFSFLLACHSP